MSHVADSPKNRHLTPISGRFTPIRPTNQRSERKGHPLSGTRETWLAPNVHLVTVLPPHASRLTPHAPRPTPLSILGGWAANWKHV